MSLKLWCPDCVTQTIIGQMSIADGDEFVCDDCKRVFYVRIERGLTSRAVDEGDSVPLQAESTPEVLSTEEADTAPALRN